MICTARDICQRALYHALQKADWKAAAICLHGSLQIMSPGYHYNDIIVYARQMRWHCHCSVERHSLSEMPTHRPCWKCGNLTSSTDEMYFCKCGHIQPPVCRSNFFDIMGVDTSFVQNSTILGKYFRTLQWNLHPDKFSGKSEEEIEYAQQQSALVNKAYTTLSNPLSRGMYLLQLNGLEITEEDKEANPDFLEEIMEMNEKIAEAHSPSTIQPLIDTNKKIVKKLILHIENAFSANDLCEARRLLKRLKYYDNITGKIQQLHQSQFG